MSDAGTFPIAIIAKVLDLDDRRIQQLTKEGMPKASRGRYNLVACANWYIRYLRARSVNPDSNASGDVKASRKRLLDANAVIAEIDADERRGILVPVEDVLSFIGACFVLIKTQIEASALAPAEQRKILVQLATLEHHDFRSSQASPSAPTPAPA